MKSIKHILNSFVSLLLIGVISLPSFVKLHHTLVEHEEKICAEHNGSQHFHEVELDCDFQKYNLAPQLYTQAQLIELRTPPVLKEEKQNHYLLISEYQKLHFSLRGPPSIS